jgi:hypothetical protein
VNAEDEYPDRGGQHRADHGSPREGARGEGLGGRQRLPPGAPAEGREDRFQAWIGCRESPLYLVENLLLTAREVHRTSREASAAPRVRFLYVRRITASREGRADPGGDGLGVPALALFDAKHHSGTP